MKNYALFLFVCSIFSTASSQPASPSVNVQERAIEKFVRIYNNEVCVDHYFSGTKQCLTRDGMDKWLPVWSKDGTKIAFIRASNKPKVKSYVVIIDETGREILNLAFHDESHNTLAPDIRSIDSIQWLNEKKLVVSGSLNPTTTEHDLINIQSAKIENQIFDDGFGASFSANGSHVTYLAGAPHFGSARGSSPNLQLDEVSIMSLPANDTSISGRPTWAPDSSLFFVRSNLSPNNLTPGLYRWDMKSKKMDRIMLPSTQSSFTVFWQGTTIVATEILDDVSQQTTPVQPLQSWLLPSNTSARWTASTHTIKNPLIDLTSLRDQFKAARGLTPDTDVWCTGCGFISLPREVHQ